MKYFNLLAVSSKKFQLVLLAAVLLFSIFSEALYTCTAFCLVKEDSVLLAKNLDWPVGDGFIILNCKGEHKKSLSTEGVPVEWTSQYNSITFNQPGKDLPLGGMNEAGLVVEELSYSPSRYPALQDIPVLNELEWTQFQLDNYSTVREVQENLGAPAVSKYFIGLHYIIMDRTGEVMVVEFLEGKIVSYTGKELPYNVLSNNSYRNSLKYLRNFTGYGGEMVITNRKSSQERFVKAVSEIDKLGDFNTTAAFSILDSVRQQSTRWSIVYDPLNLEISYRLNNSQQGSLKFRELDFSAPERIAFFYDNEENKNLIFQEIEVHKLHLFLQNYIENLVNAGEISTTTAAKLKNNLIDKRR